MDYKVKSLLSLSKKARLLVAGEFACEKSLQTKQARLLIIADDASDNTKSKFVNKCFYYHVPAIIYGDRDEISQAIGKENRVVVAITDFNFAAKLQALLEDIQTVDN